MVSINTKIKYKTKQKELVLNCIKNNGGNHITVDEIVDKLQKNNTPVGKTTVYRFLNSLVDDGVMSKYTLDENMPACFQFIENQNICSMHYHLKCDGCGELIHANSVMLNEIEQTILDKYNFKIDNTKTVYYGKCMDCLQNK